MSSSDFGVWFPQRTGLPEELPLPSETRPPSCTSASGGSRTHTGHEGPPGSRAGRASVVPSPSPYPEAQGTGPLKPGSCLAALSTAHKALGKE